MNNPVDMKYDYRSPRVAPKEHGYDPSPILRCARQQFRESHHQELRQIRCDFHEGVITLRGRVTSFYVKQLAQSIVAKLDGVEECDNRIEVRAR